MALTLPPDRIREPVARVGERSLKASAQNLNADDIRSHAAGASPSRREVAIPIQILLPTVQVF